MKFKISIICLLIVSILNPNKSIAQKKTIVPVFEKVETQGIYFQEKKKREGSYSIFYLDQIKDQGNWDSQLRKRTFFQRINPDIVEIELDTTQILALKEYNSKTKAYFYYKAFPLCIKSKTTDTLKIGFEGLIPICLEAKNKKGKWVNIENLFFWGCGVGIRDFLLYPKQTVCVKAIFYEGSFKTILRFKINGERPVYSEEFTMKINPKLLEKEKKYPWE